jgi:hypothetical protein
MFLSLIRTPKGAWQAQLCGFIFFSGFKAGEAARQAERREDIVTIVFFCAIQGQFIFPDPGIPAAGAGEQRPGEATRPPTARGLSSGHH